MCGLMHGLPVCLVLLAGANEPGDGRGIHAFLVGKHERMTTIQFSCEGHYTDHRQQRPPSVFTETFGWDRSRDRLYFDMHVARNGASERTHFMLDTRQGRRVTDHRGPIRGEPASSGTMFEHPCFATNYWFTPFLVVALGQSGFEVRSLGKEQVEATECERIVFADGDPASAKLSMHWWIDLERDGLAMRHERRTSDRLILRVTVTETKRFGNDVGVWLPVRAKRELYSDTRRDEKSQHPMKLTRTFSDTPVSTYEFHILEPSVRINEPLEKSLLVAEESPLERKAAAQPVEPEVEGAPPRYRPVGVPEDQVRAVLAAAKDQHEEYLQRLPRRTRPWDPLNVAAVVCGFASLLVCIVLIWRMRAGHG